MRYGFIYETTCLITGMKYIGKHKRYQDPNDPDDSWYLGSGILISRVVDKYGPEAFTRIILDEADTEEELCRLEEYYLNKVDAQNSDEYYNLMNRSGGGALTGESLEKMRKSLTGKSLSLETRIKMSESQCRESTQRMKSESLKGRTLPKEVRDKISASCKGKKVVFTDEHRKALSESMKRKGKWVGDNNPQYGLDHTDINNTFYGKHHTEESKKKISEAHKKLVGELAPRYGAKLTEESKKKISDSLKGRVVPQDVRNKISESVKSRRYSKICLNCGKSYVAKSAKGKYCCDECKKEYYNKRDSAVNG